MPECFFKHLGGCEGRLVKAHLIPKQRIKRECLSHNRRWHYEAEEPDLIWDPANVLWDGRCWVWMCGGPTGIGGHHGMFDNRQIRLNYTEIPTCTKEFAKEYGLEWSLERDYER